MATGHGGRVREILRRRKKELDDDAVEDLAQEHGVWSREQRARERERESARARERQRERARDLQRVFVCVYAR